MIRVRIIAKIVVYCCNNEKRFDEYLLGPVRMMFGRDGYGQYSQISTKNLVIHQYIITNINIMSQVSMLIQGSIHKL